MAAGELSLADEAERWAIDTGEGAQAAPADDVETSLARLAVLYPGKVAAGDDEARELVRRARRDPEMRRLSAALAAQQQRPQRAAPQARAREPRPRRRARSRSPSSSRDDPDEAEPPLGGHETKIICGCGCDRSFPRSSGRGRPREFFSSACRLRAWRAAQQRETKIAAPLTREQRAGLKAKIDRERRARLPEVRRAYREIDAALEEAA